MDPYPIQAARRLHVAATIVLTLSTIGAALLVLSAVKDVVGTSGDHTTAFGTIGGAIGAWMVTVMICFAGQALAAHIVASHDERSQ